MPVTCPPCAIADIERDNAIPREILRWQRLGAPSRPCRHGIHAHRFKFGKIEAEVLRDERAQSFAVW
jgi:hypothetical protein